MELKQLLSIFSALPVGVGVYSMDGTLVQFNDSFCDLFGETSKDMAGEMLNIYDSPSIPDGVKEAVRKKEPIQIQFPYSFDAALAAGRFESSELNDVCYFKCSGRPILDDQGGQVYYVFIVENVTEVVKKEEQLRQSQQKVEMALAFADVMLWEFDVKKKLFYSDNEPLNGYDRSSPITIQMYMDTIHPEDLSKSKSIMQRMIAGEDFTFSIEGQFILPDNPDWQPCSVSGSPYESDSDGRVLKYVGVRKNNIVIHNKQQLLNRILNSIPLSIHIKDVEDGFRYVFCNEESKRMFGTSENKTSYDVMNKEAVERIQKTDLEVYKTGSPYFGLERVSLIDGRSYDTIVRKSIIEDNGKRLLLNTRWDQSLQNELKRQARLLAITLQTMNAYTWFFEPDENRISFDEGFDEGKRKALDLNTVDKFMACVHPDDHQRFLNSLQEVLDEKKEMWYVETRIDFEGNGCYKWWETRGVLETSILNDAPHQYLFGMTIDIDSHKQAEITLLENKEKLKNLIRQNEQVLNNTNSGLAYITTDYMVEWENVSICSKSLTHEAYKKGEYCYKSAHNRSEPCENCVLQRASQSHQTEQIKFQLDDNHIVEIFGTPVFLEDGTMDGIVIRMDNVTERERIISELKEAKLHAEQSDKLKSAFLANMSHEIRTPLNAIVGFSEMMMQADNEEEKAEFQQIISNNNELLLKLISDILDLSKLEAGSVELKYDEFDLSEYFSNLAASMKQRITNPTLELIVVNPYTSCRVVLDKNRLAQVLTNYITNSIKYTPSGFIEMGYRRTHEGIYFYVKDSGIGIQDEKKKRVFHRFEKLDEFAQGTGLGLSICKAIAEAMGGSVGFDTEHGKGSTFWVSLPCKVDMTSCSSSPIIETNTLQTASPSGTKTATTLRRTILVAEDIQSNFLLVSTMLKDQYQLLHAKDGLEAVAMVRNGEVDLVFMDMKMPLMGGLEATAEIRQFNAQLPIIALTAHAFESDRLAAMATGCTDYLVKPIDKSKLLAALQRHL